MLSKFFSKKSRGFTLVELLIVVAIIGVLSTLGVPTFRRMIQKSKKSEAKVNLGGLFTAESAFQAEYNVYGNNLGKLGFEIEGTPSTLIYRVGFFAANSCAGNTNAEPTNTAQYNALNSAFPAYYAGYAATMSWAGYSNLNTGCHSTQVSAIATTGATFTATAQGAISPNVADRANPAGNVDVWSINDGRLLINVRDGVM